MRYLILIPAVLAALILCDTRVSADPHMQPSQGELSGRRIFVSPGHGYYWHSTLGWTTQRGVTHGMVEDHSNAMLMIDYIIPYLTNAGAVVVSARERSYETLEFVGDEGDGAYSQTGTWTSSTNVAGFYGAAYRWAATSTTETATARWTFNVPREARLPVYVWFTSGTDRAPDALYRIHHAAGIAEVQVNQTNFSHTDYSGTVNTHNWGGGWVYLGEWEFNTTQPAVVELSNQSAPGKVVIADAVKVGAGMGSIVRGAGTSGRARWLECSRYWAQYAGAPASVYDTATGEDNSDDVTARPRLMNWWGGFDLFFSLHSNADGGAGTARGTVTLSYDNSGSTQHPTDLLNQSVAFRNRMNAQVAGDMTTAHDSTWVTRNPYGGSFGELRVATTAPSCLLESAFHNNATDASYLRDPKSRHTIGRAAYKAIVRQLNPSATILPLPPTHLAMRNTAAGQVTISWQPQADPLEASAVATGYRVYLSSDGFAFDSGRVANGGTSHTLNVAPGELVFAKVTATNAGGESLTSEVMSARAPDAQAQGLVTPLLIVSGYDRLDEFVWYQQGASVHTGNMHMRNQRDSVRRNALAAANASTAGGGSFFFDGAANECVIDGSVALTDYEAANWVLGNESTDDATFDATERAAVQAFMAAGGRLFVSGGDVGFATDAAFLADLGAGFVNTSSGVWTGSAVAGGVFDGVGAFTIDNGTGNNYTVLSPDVLSTQAGALPALTYTGGAVAAVASSNAVVVGFPFECINEEGARNALMQATLEFVLPGYTGVYVPTNPPPSTGNGGGSKSSGCAVSPLGSVPAAFGLLAFGLLGLRRRTIRL